MQRQGFSLPLMIGGATTSKAHTAVKIDPQYSNDAVVYVTDASRAVGVATTLLSKELKPAFVDKTREEYAMIRERTANRSARTERLSYLDAIANKPPFDWSGYIPVKPSFTGRQVLEDIDLRTLVDYIDWTPFFIAWDLAGKYPRILEDEVVGEAATSLFNDAQAMLKKLVDEKLIRARAVFGFWPANQIQDDDLEVYGDNGEKLATLHHLRQQTIKPDAKPNLSLADFVAPKSTGITDYVGGFICTAGIGAEELAKAYQDKGDDYNSIMVKALADRLAEACAEWLHEQVRKHYWGYAPDERLSNEELIREQYKGIRPAPVTRPARTTPRRARCSSCWMPTASARSRSPSTTPCCPPRRSAAGTSPIPRRSISLSARSTRIRWKATASARARNWPSVSAG